MKKPTLTFLTSVVPSPNGAEEEVRAYMVMVSYSKLFRVHLWIILYPENEPLCQSLSFSNVDVSVVRLRQLASNSDSIADQLSTSLSHANYIHIFRSPILYEHTNVLWDLDEKGIELAKAAGFSDDELSSYFSKCKLVYSNEALKKNVLRNPVIVFPSEGTQDQIDIVIISQLNSIKSRAQNDLSKTGSLNTEKMPSGSSLPAETSHSLGEQFDARVRLNSDDFLIYTRSQVKRLLIKSPQKLYEIHAIINHTHLEAKKLTRTDLFLDTAAISNGCLSLKYVGAIPINSVWMFITKVTLRFVRLICRRFAFKLQVSASALEDALYFPVLTQLLTLIPVRHFARSVARCAGAEPILVPLTDHVGTYLSYWTQSSSIEPFILVAELRRRGANAALIIDASGKDPQLIPNGGFMFTFNPDPTYWPTGAVQSLTPTKGKKAVVLSGMRGLHMVLNEIENLFFVKGGFAIDLPGYHANLSDNATALPSVQMNFEERFSSEESNKCFTFISHQPRWESLIDYLFFTIGEYCKTVATAAIDVVAANGIEEVLVCDHLFFESSFLVDAVRAAGGKIALWPHATNTVGLNERGVRPPNHVTCVTQIAASAWKTRHPDVEVTVSSDVMLIPNRTIQKIDPLEPLNIIVIATAHRVNLLPIFDVQAHRESYRGLFKALKELTPKIRFFVKAKPTWEEFDWLQSIAGPECLLCETLELPSLINLPNMIFLTVSLTSSAAFEVLGRGMPVMIVRDMPVVDDYGITPDDIIIGPLESVINEIKRCCDYSYLEELTQRQVEWYNSVTDFGIS